MTSAVESGRVPLTGPWKRWVEPASDTPPGEPRLLPSSTSATPSPLTSPTGAGLMPMNQFVVVAVNTAPASPVLTVLPQSSQAASAALSELSQSFTTPSPQTSVSPGYTVSSVSRQSPGTRVHAPSGGSQPMCEAPSAPLP